MMVEIKIFSNKEEMGKVSADKAVELLKKALSSKEKACFIAATGASQFDFLKALTHHNGIEWQRTVMFHLDEYIGLSATHPASFRKYLKEKIVDVVHPGEVHFIEGDAPDPIQECKRINELISQVKIDVAFVGIGENGHLAFNDPPADFETEEPYLIVDLDEKCRAQQIGEGWFDSMDEVPTQAISMSIKQIMKSEAIICTCPDKRKAEAVRDCLSVDAKITPDHPASILKQHNKTYCFLDEESASLLKK